LALAAGYVPRWFTCPRTVIHPVVLTGLTFSNFVDAPNAFTDINYII